MTGLSVEGRYSVQTGLSYRVKHGGENRISAGEKNQRKKTKNQRKKNEEAAEKNEESAEKNEESAGKCPEENAITKRSQATDTKNTRTVTFRQTHLRQGRKTTTTPFSPTPYFLFTVTINTLDFIRISVTHDATQLRPFFTRYQTHCDRNR